MTHDTTTPPPSAIRSWPALALGTAFAGLTAWSMLADVLAGREAFTPAHRMSLGAIAAAIAAGHYFLPQLRRGAIVPALLLAVLFVAATVYTVISAAARNAEVGASKSAKVQANNEARARELKSLALNSDMLANVQRQLAAECRSGKGPRCDGLRASIAVYTDAVKGNNATLAALGPELAPAGGYAHAARTLGMLPGVGAKPEAIEQQLVLLLPFATVLVAELASIVFLGLAIGHRPAPAAPVAVPEPAPAAPAPPRGPTGGSRQRRTTRKEQARAEVIQFRRPVAQAELAQRWNVTKSMVSMWLDEFEADGIVQRVRTGRSTIVQPAPRLRAVA